MGYKKTGKRPTAIGQLWVFWVHTCNVHQTSDIILLASFFGRVCRENVLGNMYNNLYKSINIYMSLFFSKLLLVVKVVTFFFVKISVKYQFSIMPTILQSIYTTQRLIILYQICFWNRLTLNWSTTSIIVKL